MILMIDNYDSFTYNLVQFLGELGQEINVYRNDKISVEEVNELQPDHIVISPGPRTPDEAGISMDIIKEFSGKIPLLGVCLGHQSIGQVFGGKIVRADNLMHGKTSQINHDGQTIYQGLPQDFIATRYHSLIIHEDSIPECLEVTARTAEGEIMGVRHREYIVEGVQFHPESILTESGKKLLSNFISLSYQKS